MSQSDDTSDNFDLEGVCQPGNENTGRWTSDEHRLFLKGLELHGKGWKQIATVIQTRTVVQIRTHSQKYFQKLTKAQASGTSHLDPATLMSTMDAGKPRPATVARNLRSSTIAHGAADSEGRLRSLPKRHNRGRNSRIDHDQYSDDTSGDDSKDSNRRRRSSSSSSSGRSRRSSGGSGSSANSRDGLSSEEDDDEKEERHQKQEIAPGVYKVADPANEGNEAPSHDLSVSGSKEGLKRTGGLQGTPISPTSVSDINSMSFPVPQTEQSDIARHQLPQRLVPPWCTKPKDIGGDSNDPGAFRWFIDERSVSKPGAFFQPPTEAWGGSDTTDASTSGGVSSGGEGIEGAYRAVVDDLSIGTNNVGASPRDSNGASYVDAVSMDDAADSHLAKRRRVEPTGTIDAEVNRHVDADAENGLDITSGRWPDHLQEASSLMCGLGLSAPSVAGPGGSLSMPSLDEDEVLGFLACD